MRKVEKRECIGTCGHKYDVEIPEGSAAYQLAIHQEGFKVLCPECLRAWEEEQKQAFKHRVWLPSLQGVSEKQVKFGEDCRIMVLMEIEKQVQGKEEYREAYIALCLQVSASWWIDQVKKIKSSILTLENIRESVSVKTPSPEVNLTEEDTGELEELLAA